MPHLVVRELQNQPSVIDLTPAFQFCVRRAYLNNILGTALDIIAAVGGVLILVLLKIWEPAQGASKHNTVVVYSITGIAALVSFATALTSRLNFSRKAAKCGRVKIGK